MTKVIEQMKTKKLAKKIAGVTLGAFALGAMSMSPTYAAVYLHGGTPDHNDYKGDEPDYAVTIDGSSTGGTALGSNFNIYGNFDNPDPVSGVITGKITAGNVTDTATGIIVYGGRYSGAGEVKGLDNEVTWKVKGVSLKQAFGVFAWAADGVSATGTKVEIAEGVQVGANGYIQGTYLIANSKNATATGTKVTLNGVTAEYAEVYGDEVESEQKEATSTDAEIKITGGTYKNIYGALVKSAGTSVGEGTQLTLDNVTTTSIDSKVYGDYVKSNTLAKATGTADKPTVSINGGTLNEVYGAYLDVFTSGETGEKAEADGITVKLKDAKINFTPTSKVYGVNIGDIKKSDVKNTTLDVTGGETNYIYGVYQAFAAADSLTANDTTLTLNGANIKEEVYGVYGSQIKEINATNTKITLEGKPGTARYVYGVNFETNITSATAEGTEVNITGGEFARGVYGTYIAVSDAAKEKGEATGTNVTINNAKVGDEAENGYVHGDVIYAQKEAKSDGANVEITGGKVGSNVHGANLGATGDEGEATATNTTVTIKNISNEGKPEVTGAHVFAKKLAKADNTKVDITGGEIKQVNGAYFYGDTKGDATANVTDVILNKMTAEGVVGVAVDAVKSADISGTTIDLQGSTINKSVHGVFFEIDANDTATIKNTKIILDGTEVENSVFGVNAGATNGVTTDNTQIIFQGVRSIVKGSVSGERLTNVKSSTNTSLTVNNIGNEVGNIDSFDKINFVLPDGVKNDDVMLNLTKAEKTDLQNTEIETTSAVIAPGASVKEGDKIYLIKKNGGDLLLKGGKAPEDEVFIVKDGFTTKTGQYELKDNNLLLNVIFEEEPHDPMEVEDNKKSATETIAASVALLNNGADFATEQALSEAKSAAKEGTAEGTRAMMPFAAFGGNSMKYKSGSHIDAKGWNAALGFAKEQGELTYGIAVEHGQANYDSYVNQAHGEGKNKYTGGVIFAELKKESGAHFDASFRAGKAKSDYSANLTVLGHTFATDYNTSATYLGFSVGGGKETKLSDAGSLDLYARYYFNHLGASNTTTNTGTDIDFKASDSSRLRLGTRYTQKMDERNKLYAGLAWQYEFAGKAKAVINGVDAPSPSMKGHSGMAELGWKAKASKNLDIDLGVNGWLGKQRGIAGNIGFKWSF